MGESDLEENIGYVVQAVEEFPGQYDLRSLMFKFEPKLSKLEVWHAVYAATKRGLVKPQDVNIGEDGRGGIIIRTYFPANGKAE